MASSLHSTEGYDDGSVTIVGSNPNTNLPPRTGFLSGTGNYALSEAIEIRNGINDFSGTSASGTGYYEIVFSVSPPPMSFPDLRTQLSTNQLTLTWPFEVYGYNLEQTTNLESASWSAVTNVPVLINTNYAIVIPVDQPAMFFRLHHP